MRVLKDTISHRSLVSLSLILIVLLALCSKLSFVSPTFTPGGFFTHLLRDRYGLSLSPRSPFWGPWGLPASFPSFPSLPSLPSLPPLLSRFSPSLFLALALSLLFSSSPSSRSRSRGLWPRPLPPFPLALGGCGLVPSFGFRCSGPQP